MENISGFGLVVQVRASKTFPAGFTVTQFADDGDPFDVPSIQVNDKAMGLNGDLIVWSKANPIAVTLNLIPASDDDKNMSILLEANRVGRGKQSAKDVITLTAIYPDGRTLTLTEGVITDGMPANSIASAGRMKSKPYIFAFENRTGAQ
ncbi:MULTISPECIES: phage tail fiber protein [Ralstonia solanacearum species complex]|uniref:phage tail fiber protein n=1 Tax=Ralstonia solanacearum species complex TaxID=3116862 RepID=UPI0018D10C68|nr:MULTISPECIES: hypothetical protein [Ralstonia solanacearum species complex]